MAILLLAATTLAVIAWLAGQPLYAAWRRRRVRAAPFPPEWRAILRRHVPQYRRLPPDLQRQLRERILLFVDEKAFIGCAGQPIDDTVRVTIAAQAGLLLLNRPEQSFASLREVLVYPGPFVVERLRPEPSGVLQETRTVLSGESWSRGHVVLSWQDVLEGAADPGDGRNVVIHEFAHQLDQEKGYANGAPARVGARHPGDWARVMGEEFARLRAADPLGPPPLLDPYGATDPAEFFAVASEVFFERPAALAIRHPALYQALAGYYRVDPATWPG